MFIRLFLGLLALLSLSTFEARADEGRARLASPLLVPMNLPLTGPYATYGAAVEEGVRFALEDRKAASLPVPIDFDFQDNEGKAAKTVSVFREQLLKNPAIYVSGVRPQTMAIWDEAARRKIPHFLWIFDRSIEKDGAPGFRTYVSFKVEPPIFLEYAKKKAWKRVAILYVRLPSTEDEYQNAVLPGLRAAGSELLVQPYELDKDDFRDLTAKVRHFQPDGIILCGFQNQLVSLIKSLRTMQLIHDGNTLATYDMIDAAPLLPAADVEGVRFTTPAFLLEGETGRYHAWRSRFEARFHHAPLYTQAYAYDMANVLIDAANRAEDRSPEALTRALRATNLDGVTGPLRFDASGDLDVKVDLGVFRSGKGVRESF